MFARAKGQNTRCHDLNWVSALTKPVYLLFWKFESSVCTDLWPLKLTFQFLSKYMSLFFLCRYKRKKMYCCIAIYIYKRKHNQRLFTTSMNERTHFFIKKIYISHFILERVDVSVVCERWVETGTACYIDQTSSLDHSTLCYLQEPP